MNRTHIADAPHVDVYASHAVLALTGITYRQLDYWTRKRWVRASVTDPGTGYDRRWERHEVVIAALMGRLVRRGVDVERAALIARAAVRSGQGEPFSVPLGDGLTLTGTVPEVFGEAVS